MMKEAGFLRPGVAFQVFWLSERRISVVIHGDDFLAIARRHDADWLDEILDQNMMSNRGPRMGPPQHGGWTTGSFLKGEIAWTPEGFCWRHDLARVTTIVGACLGDKRLPERAVPPSSKHVGKAARAAADPLDYESKKKFQRLAARALYVAGDRVEIQNAVTHLMRGMANPLQLRWLQLCRLASYLSLARTMRLGSSTRTCRP